MKRPTVRCPQGTGSSPVLWSAYRLDAWAWFPVLNLILVCCNGSKLKQIFPDDILTSLCYREFLVCRMTHFSSVFFQSKPAHVCPLNDKSGCIVRELETHIEDKRWSEEKIVRQGKEIWTLNADSMYDLILCQFLCLRVSL